MKRVSMLAAVVAIIASPAFAGSGKFEAQYAPRAASYDRYGVKKHHHTDPDPNVLFEMKRQRNWRKG